MACLAACGKDTVVTQRRVVANVPAACAVGAQGFATYYPLGDFEPASAPASLSFSATGKPLAQLDGATRQLVLSAQLGVSTWEGVGPVGASGDVNVLVLPQFQPCALSQGVGMRTGSALGVVGSGRALLAGGAVGRSAPPEYVVHLDTGVLTPASPPLLHQRTQATVTAFAGGGLVAGGLRTDNGTALPEAQVLDPGSDGFTTEILLSEPRRGHAAVVLANGDTLLVGGYGDATASSPLTSLERVYATSSCVQGGEECSTETDEGPLFPLLVDPVAVRLADGEVLVAGGAQTEGPNVTGLQWFGTMGEGQSIPMFPIPGGPPFALAALQGGGALVVVTPPPNPPASFKTTWVVGADRSVTAAASVQGSLTAPILLGGAGGAPLLWTGDRWLQWQPWLGAFGLAVGLEGVSANIGDARATLDPGLAMWLDPSQQRLVALRTATTNAYSEDPVAFLTPDDTGVAPDSLPGVGGVTYTGGTGLTLPLGTSAFVTDRTYADVSIRVRFDAGQPPSVLLRDNQAALYFVDDTCCAGLLDASSPQPVMDIERHGATITCAVDGAAASTCPTTLGPAARVSVGVGGLRRGVPSLVEEIIVTRLGAP